MHQKLHRVVCVRSKCPPCGENVSADNKVLSENNKGKILQFLRVQTDKRSSNDESSFGRTYERKKFGEST